MGNRLARQKTRVCTSTAVGFGIYSLKFVLCIPFINFHFLVELFKYCIIASSSSILIGGGGGGGGGHGAALSPVQTRNV